MSIVQTTLAAAAAASDTTISVTTGSSGFPVVGGPVLTPGYLCRVDKEYFYAIQQPTTGIVKVRGRGSMGTIASAHDILSQIEVSADTTDFANPSAGFDTTLPPYLPVYASLGQNTTFTAAQVASWGNQARNFALTKATAIAIVLPAPSKAQDGLVVTFTSLVAVLDAITATALLANGATSSPYTTATKADTKIGGALVLQAQNGLWNVISNLGWTLTS